MIRYAIVGAGRMGNAHANNLSCIENAQLAGVYDILPERSRELAQKHNAAACSSLDELLALPNLDCLIVTTPTYAHADAVQAACQANIGIFCEKPLCRTQDDADRLLALLEGYQKLFAVGFVRRHMYKVIKAKQMLDANTLGRILYCNVDLPHGKYKRMPGDWFADFELCGGAILDMLAHHVDLCNWFFGQPVNVYASSLLLDSKLPLPADYVASIVNYDSGVICNLMSSWQRVGRSGEMMEIQGEKGTLIIDGTDLLTYYDQQGNLQKIDPAAEFPAPKVAGHGVDNVNAASGFFRQSLSLTSALAGEKLPLPGIKEAYDSLKVGLAMIESSQTGKVVAF